MGIFKWVPAGVEHKIFGGAGIYVKHGRYPNKIVIKEKTGGYIWLQCPDRELFIVKNSQFYTSDYPTTGNYDYYVDLGLFNDKLFKDHGFDYIMLNYTNDLGKEHMSPKTRTFGNRGTTFLSDSGGFQILNNVYDYLDPKKIVNWYNDNVDIGLILDIPTNIVQPGLHKRLALVQKENTNIMLDNKRDSLELMNIFHGDTEDERKEFRDICETDKINKLAIGGSYFTTIMSSIDRLVGAMTEGKTYDHYHVLGVSKALQLSCLMYMAHKDVAPLITSDSTTFIQAAVTKGYHMQPSLLESPRMVTIGDSHNIPSVTKILPCNCPVCSALKYVDILGILSGPVWILLMYHNMFSMQRYFNTMQHMIQTLELSEYKQLLKAQFNSGNRHIGKVKEILSTLDYIDVVVNEGLEVARKKYRYYLSRIIHPSNSSALIDNPKEEVASDPNMLRMDSILTTYENKNGSHGQKYKDRKKRTKATSLTSGIVSGPNKKRNKKVK